MSRLLTIFADLNSSFVMKDPSFSKAAVEPSRLCGKVKKDVQASVSTINSYFIFVENRLPEATPPSRPETTFFLVQFIVDVFDRLVPTRPTGKALVALTWRWTIEARLGDA